MLAALLWSFGGSMLAAQEPSPVEEAAPEESRGLQITFHGYLTQAYAQIDEHQFLGIIEDGTTDYRTAALQIRADVTKKDSFVVQFSHERFGASRVQAIKDDVELDWIFYEHKFGTSAIKVGRVQIPFGIYNQVRDVGTLLPFYRPSHNFYGEAAFSSETVDGAVFSHAFQLGGRWGLEADLHYGDWEFITRNFGTGAYLARDVNDSIGAELWLETPVSGLRFGAGGMRYDLAPATATAKEVRWEAYHVSAAGDFDRFAVHAEFKEVDIVTAKARSQYAHLGVNLTEKLTLNGQVDRLYYKAKTASSRITLDDDRAAGVNYAFNPALVLKAEHHWNEGGFWLEDVAAFGASGLKTRYWLVSLSTSF